MNSSEIRMMLAVLMAAVSSPTIADTYVHDEATRSLGGSIGINGQPCAFNTFGQALASATSGDTIYVRPSNRIELIGKIDIDLTFVPAEAAGPEFSGCEQEMASAASDTVIIDGNGLNLNDTGGIVEVRNGASVTFRHMWLRNARRH